MKSICFALKSKIGYISIAVCFFVIALVSASVVSDIQADKKAEQKRQNQLVEEYSASIEELTAEQEKLAADIDELNAKYEGYLDNLAASNLDYYNLVKQYEKLNEQYKFYGGITTVQGEGIRILLDDGESADGSVASYMVVHDSTLINIVDALRNAGAGAISINGERIVSMTDIVCVGPSIRVNGKKLFAPFDIKAIGDSQTLYNSFIAGDVYATISYSELKVDVEQAETVIVEGYSGAYERDSNRLVPSK